MGILGFFGGSVIQQLGECLLLCDIAQSLRSAGHFLVYDSFLTHVHLWNSFHCLILFQYI